MPSTIDAARRLIQSRLTDLDAEATQLRRALVSQGESASGPPPRSRPARQSHHHWCDFSSTKTSPLR